MKVTTTYDTPTSSVIVIEGLPDGWGGDDLTAGFTAALEAFVAEARGRPAPAGDPFDVDVDVRVLPAAQAPAAPPRPPSDVTAPPAPRPTVCHVTGLALDGAVEEPIGGAVLGVSVGLDTLPCGCPDIPPYDDEDGDYLEEPDAGPDLRVGTAIARLGLRKVEDVTPADIADAAFPDDIHLNSALVGLLRLAELRMQYAAAGRKVSGRTDMQKLWDLDSTIAKARRDAWARIGKEEKDYE